METVTVTFKHAKETKNAHQFSEVDAKGKPVEMADAKIGSIYMKKSVVGENAPATITVTVEFTPAKAAKKAASTTAKKEAAPVSLAKASKILGKKLVKKAPAKKRA